MDEKKTTKDPNQNIMSTMASHFLKDMISGVDKKELVKYSLLAGLGGGIYYLLNHQANVRANPASKLKYQVEALGIDHELSEALVLLQEYENVELLYNENPNDPPVLFKDAVTSIDSLIKLEMVLADDKVLPNMDMMNRAALCYKEAYDNLQKLLLMITNESGVEYGVTAQTHITIVTNRLSEHYDNILSLFNYIDLHKVQERAQQDILAKVMKKRALFYEKEKAKKKKKYHHKHRPPPFVL